MPLFRALLFTWLVLLASCSKEDAGFVTSEAVPSGTTVRLQGLRAGPGGSLLACGGEGDRGLILRSDDAGHTWYAWYDAFDQPVYDVCFTGPSTGYASGERSEVFKTTDGGTTWQKLWINVPMFPDEFRKPLRKVCAAGDSLLFFAGGSDFEAGVIVRTTDGGTAWQVTTFTFELRDLLFTDALHGLACGYGVMLETIDGGDHWEPVASPDAYYTALARDGDGGTWAASFNGGLYVSAGGAWQEALGGNGVFGGRRHFTALQASGTTLVACGADGAFGYRPDPAEAWLTGRAFDGITMKALWADGNGGGVAVGEGGAIRLFRIKN